MGTSKIRKCPKCKRTLLKAPNQFICREGCNFKIGTGIETEKVETDILDNSFLDEYKKRLADLQKDYILEQYEKYRGPFTPNWQQQLEKYLNRDN